MTRTQYYVASSIDGYIADSQGRLDWLFQFDGAEGVAEHYKSFMEGVGALAMGAATYEFVLGQGLKEWPYAGLPTWVFTHRTLPVFPGADLRFTTEDVGRVHEEMVRAADGRNIWVVGGGNLVAQFAQRGLLDELLLGLMPVVLGGGVPLLPTALPGRLELKAVTRFGMGAVELRYDIPKAPASRPG